MFAQLGKHIFQGLKSPNSLSEKQSVKFGRISLINGKDIIQFTGEDLAECELTIMYSVDFCNPLAEIDALRKSMRLAEVLPFIMGDGTAVGNFVITNVSLTGQRYSPTGALQVADVSVSLLECTMTVEAKPIGKAVIARTPTNAIAGGVAIKVPAIKPPVPAVLSPAKSITSSISKGKNAINKMKKVGAAVKKGTTSFKNGVKEVRELAETAKQAYTTAKNKVDVTIKIINRAKELPTSLEGVIKYAENLAQLDNVLDSTTLQANISEISKCADKVTQSATPVAAFAALKEGGK